MLQSELINYINEPEILNDESITKLTLLAEKYPYFQTVQLLRIKNLHNLSPQNIKPALNYTAAYVTDRKILYHILHPIQSEQEQQGGRSFEKEIKDNMQENISDTLHKQISTSLSGKEDNEIEFTTSIDVKKLYGNGEQDEYVIRINESATNSIELIREVNEDNNNKDNGSSKSQVEHKDISDKDDILTLINKNIPAKEGINDIEKFTSDQQKKISLIDNFIKANPKIEPVKSKEEKNKDFSEESIKESDHYITDTLANIYLNQGNYSKAIFAYEKLSLKYPEKSSYFADQINKIKKLIDKTK